LDGLVISRICKIDEISFAQPFSAIIRKLMSPLGFR
jgi:hypothetical protein